MSTTTDRDRIIASLDALSAHLLEHAAFVQAVDRVADHFNARGLIQSGLHAEGLVDTGISELRTRADSLGAIATDIVTSEPVFERQSAEWFLEAVGRRFDEIARNITAIVDGRLAGIALDTGIGARVVGSAASARSTLVARINAAAERVRNAHKKAKSATHYAFGLAILSTLLSITLSTAISIAVVENRRERREAVVRADEHLMSRRKELSDEIIPQLRRITELSIGIGASLKLQRDPNSAPVDSLVNLVESMLMAHRETGATIARAFTDSVGINYAKMVFVADSATHALMALPNVDIMRTKPKALEELRSKIMRQMNTTGSLALRVQDAMLASR